MMMKVSEVTERGLVDVSEGPKVAEALTVNWLPTEAVLSTVTNPVALTVATLVSLVVQETKFVITALETPLSEGATEARNWIVWPGVMLDGTMLVFCGPTEREVGAVPV